ncbi:MAG: helix-turn-helix domain-containing protein [Pseudonocardiaceae bacterium]
MSRREPLRFEEREIIFRELSRGRKARYIGKLLGRHHSTIYDEIDRNGGATNYRALDAQRRAEDNRARPKDRKLETSVRLHDAVNGERGTAPQLVTRADQQEADRRPSR